MYSTRVYNVADCVKHVVPIARWFPTANDFGMDLLNPTIIAALST